MLQTITWKVATDPITYSLTILTRFWRLSRVWDTENNRIFSPLMWRIKKDRAISELIFKSKQVTCGLASERSQNPNHKIPEGRSRPKYKTEASPLSHHTPRSLTLINSASDGCWEAEECESCHVICFLEPELAGEEPHTRDGEEQALQWNSLLSY